MIVSRVFRGSDPNLGQRVSLVGVRRLLSPPWRLNTPAWSIISRTLDVSRNWLLVWFLTHHPLTLERQISIRIVATRSR